MVLIVSDEQDVSTNNVIDWLVYFKVPFLRINENDGVKLSQVAFKNGSLHFQFEIHKNAFGTTFLLSEKEVVLYWYRRGCLKLYANMPHCYTPPFEYVFNDLNQYLIDENMKIVDFIHHYLKSIPHVNSFNDNGINKMSALFEAQQCGLTIPETFIIDSKAELEVLLRTDKKYIVKGIDRNGFSIHNSYSVGTLTFMLTAQSLGKVPQTFNYSLVQEYIEKQVDIRVFYLDGQTFPTAIFSQSDNKTKIDFRNYNYDRPNRIVPFRLPKHIKNSIIKLMRKLDLNSGSLDLVLDREGDLFFLEVNPVGQYDFISKQCNLQLDRIIAKHICDKYETENNKR